MALLELCQGDQARPFFIIVEVMMREEGRSTCLYKPGCSRTTSLLKGRNPDVAHARHGSCTYLSLALVLTLFHLGLPRPSFVDEMLVLALSEIMYGGYYEARTKKVFVHEITLAGKVGTKH